MHRVLAMNPPPPPPSSYERGRKKSLDVTAIPYEHGVEGSAGRREECGHTGLEPRVPVVDEGVDAAEDIGN